MEHRTQIYLEKKHYQFLKELSVREGISLAQAIRDLIEKQMTPSDKAWEEDPIWNRKQVNFRSGFKDASSRHHEILRAKLKSKHSPQ